MGIFDKIREGLKKTRDSISGQITQMVNSFTKIDEELFEELEELLVMGDVGVPTATYITGQLRQKVPSWRTSSRGMTPCTSAPNPR